MSDKVLVIGNKNYSSWSMRPWVWMRHHGISFKEQRIPLHTPETADQIAACGAGSTVPILIDGELRVWDSLAILEHLAEQYPDCAGWPSDVAARAQARSISAEMHSGFMALRSEMPMNCRQKIRDISMSDLAQKDVDRINTIFNDCRQQYANTGEWLFGEYSIVDAMFTPVVMRFNTYGIGLDSMAADYLQTVSAQAAVVEWVDASHQETEVIESEEM